MEEWIGMARGCSDEWIVDGWIWGGIGMNKGWMGILEYKIYMDLEASCDCIPCHGQANSFRFRNSLCVVLAMLLDANISLFFRNLYCSKR